MKGPLFEKVSEFTLIVTCPPKTKLMDAFSKHVQSLAIKQVSFDLWWSEKFAKKLEKHPALVTRFFSKHWANHFCITDYDTAPLSIYKLLERAKENDPAVHRAMDEQSSDWPVGRHQHLRGDELNYFIFGNEQVRIEARLPTGRSPVGSCVITLKQLSASALQLTLSHSDIIDRLFGGIGTGASEKRSIYRYEKNNPYAGIVVQIGDARLHVSLLTYGHLCEAIDRLYDVYIGALERLDDIWESHGFAFIRHAFDGAVSVRLGEIPLWFWKMIEALGEDYKFRDSAEGPVVVDARRSGISLYTTATTSAMNAGYHLRLTRGEIEVIESWEGGSSYYVKLIWVPPDSKQSIEACGCREYWGCETASDWIRTALIPNLMRKLQVVPPSLFDWIWRRRQAPETLPSPDEIFRLAREPSLTPNQHKLGLSDLVAVVRRLQTFASYETREQYTDAAILLGVYTAIRFALTRSRLSYFGYICNKLCLDASTVGDIDDLSTQIAGKMDVIRPGEFIHWGMVDLALRSLLAVIDRSIINFNAAECRKVMEQLEPIVRLRSREVLLRRHNPRMT